MAKGSGGLLLLIIMLLFIGNRIYESTREPEIGFAVYAVVTGLKLAKERNAYLKAIAEELRRR